MSVELSELRSHHRTKLCVDREYGGTFHDTSVPDGATALLCWTPPSRPGACFLLAASDDAAPLRLSGDFAPAPVISLWLQRSPDGTARLRHPFTGRYLCAHVFGSIRELVIDRTEAGDWETWTLHPSSEAGEPVRDTIATLATLVSLLRNGADVIAYLESGAWLPRHTAFLPAVLRLLDPREIEWLGCRLHSRPDAVLALRKALPLDIWAAQALPLLVDALQGRNGPTMRSIDETLDALAEAGHHHTHATAAQMCNAYARRAHRPTKGLCLVATARNEGPYFLEWLAHHRLVGVEAFFIYTNDNDAGSDALMSALAAAGVITLIRNKVGAGVSPQYKAYGHAFQMLPELPDYRWAAVIDIDEFLVHDTASYNSIPDFIERSMWPSTDAIGLNWSMYPATDQICRSPAPVTHRFLRREPSLNPHIKSISRPGMFMHTQCHYPITDHRSPVTFLMANGAPHTPPAGQPWSTAHLTPRNPGAWVNHYHTKSAEEFMLRRSVGRADMDLNLKISTDLLHEPMIKEFRSWFGSPDAVEDSSAMESTPGLLAEMASLAALPNVAEALRMIEMDYQARREAVLRALQADARFRDPTSHGHWLMTLVQSAEP
jgi:hypothetical protein